MYNIIKEVQYKGKLVAYRVTDEDGTEMIITKDFLIQEHKKNKVANCSILKGTNGDYIKPIEGVYEIEDWVGENPKSEEIRNKLNEAKFEIKREKGEVYYTIYCD